MPPGAVPTTRSLVGQFVSITRSACSRHNDAARRVAGAALPDTPAEAPPAAWRCPPKWAKAQRWRAGRWPRARTLQGSAGRPAADECGGRRGLAMRGMRDEAVLITMGHRALGGGLAPRRVGRDQAGAPAAPPRCSHGGRPRAASRAVMWRLDADSSKPRPAAAAPPGLDAASALGLGARQPWLGASCRLWR